MDALSYGAAIAVIVGIAIGVQTLVWLSGWLMRRRLKSKLAPQRIRWIETNYHTGEPEATFEGSVVREYFRVPTRLGCERELWLEIKLNNGNALHFPERAFNCAADGVLEFKTRTRSDSQPEPAKPMIERLTPFLMEAKSMRDSSPVGGVDYRKWADVVSYLHLAIDRLK